METERCILTNIIQEDYDDIKNLYLDENAREFLGGTIDEETYNLKFINMCKSMDDSFYLIARKKDNKEFIGLVTLDLHHDGVSTEISYQFLPNFWGCGYALEVVQEVINYAFNELRLEKLVAETQTANKSSIKLLKKLGMALDKNVERFGKEQSIFCLNNINH